MTILHRWTSVAKAVTALRTDAVAIPRWSHFLESEQRFARGTSWSTDPVRWQIDNPVCLVMDDSALPNKVHSIAGSRTFWLTKGMIDRNADPKAYLLEPTEIDEEFVEGRIAGLKTHLVGIVMPVPDAAVVEFARIRGIALLDAAPQPLPSP